MLKIANIKRPLLLIVFITSLMASISAYLPVSAQVPGCDSGSALAIENCVERYVQDEIKSQCGSLAADSAERCAQSTRGSILSGDYNYNGVTDSEESSTPGNLEGDCKGDDLSKDCAIVEYLKLFINVLSGIVGVVIVIMITVGGIQYSTARDNPQAAAAAKGRITNAVMALVFYLFIFAFLQYIVPGGVL